MKNQKDVCLIHKQNIICYGDNNPICSLCDFDNFWSIESCQTKDDKKFQASQKQKSQVRILISLLKRKVQKLTQTLEVIKQQQINKINNIFEEFLKQNYQIDIIGEYSENLDKLQKTFDLSLLQFEQTSAQIITIVQPKHNRLVAFNEQQLQLTNKVDLEKEQIRQIKVQEVQRIQEQELMDEDQNIDDMYDNEVMDRLKQIPTTNVYFSEEQFVQRVQTQLFGTQLYDEFIFKKLCIDFAPKQLLSLNRKHNLYDASTQDLLVVFGYSKNYMLNGRGVVFNESYIENGFYIKGLLVWGQIFYQMNNNNILYEEIDNSESIEDIISYEKTSILWNRSHYQRVTNLE